MSNSITCPNCGQKINLDESDYAQILSQVSEEELHRRLQEHEKALLAEQKSAILKAEGAVREELQAKLAEKDQQLAALKAKSEAQEEKSKREVEAARQEGALALKDAQSSTQAAVAEKDKLIAALQEKVKAQEAAQADAVKLAVADAEAKAKELQSKLVQAEQQAKHAADAQSKERELALAGAKSEAAAKLAEKDNKIAALEQQIASAQEGFEAQRRAAVIEEQSRQSVRVAELEKAAELARSERAQVEASLTQQKLELEKHLRQTIADKDAEIERIRDQKARLSTKLLGESLEQHCENEFKKWRPTAFQNAEFHKDNEAVVGEDGKATKGDYIFRECDEDGNEIISIMFEMKTEDEQSTNKKTNESHLKKLDEDRRKKKCEYAVLVSLLEPENELYSGITDVSWAYDKMYVIRPQFFISMITLLRNAAMTTMAEKRELARVRQQNVDVTNFEAALNTFKDGFATDLRHAEKKFDAADEAISKAIKSLEKWRDEIRLVKVHLYRADKKVEDISVKKLTKGNPTMEALFDVARQKAEKVTPTELPADGESAVEPDSLE